MTSKTLLTTSSNPYKRCTLVIQKPYSIKQNIIHLHPYIKIEGGLLSRVTHALYLEFNQVDNNIGDKGAKYITNLNAPLLTELGVGNSGAR